MKLTGNVVISDTLTGSLQTHQLCLLIGALREEEIHLAACVPCPAKTEETIHKTVKEVETLLPGGLSVCGLSEHVSEKEVSSTVSSFAQLTSCFEYAEPVCICLVGDGSLTATVVDQAGATRQLSVSTQSHYKAWRLARVTANIPVSVCLGDRDSWKAHLHNNIIKICETISSSKTRFHLQGSRIILGKAGCIGADDDDTCDTLLTASSALDDERGRRKKDSKSLDVLNFDLYTDLSTNGTDDSSTCAPIINYNMETVRQCRMTLHVDALVILHPTSAARQIADLLSVSITRQLVSMENCINKHSKGEKLIKPQPFHIKLSGFPSMVTVMYPHNVPDEKLVEERRLLHVQFCLATDRPMFKKANQFVFPADLERLGYLVNVHEYVPPSKVSGGSQYLVQGQYTYHHYMQDRFDDNKWGCAYRSLQTLVSWFRLQGYSDKPIPSHRDIQQTLVDIGDKEPKFVGSRLWIGSMEVSFVLDTYLGVTSKILNVSSGGDLASKGRELAAHFTSQGTPIMIGGGVLAHTILGVDYNEVTGDINFLILDPHYTGAEDIKIIVDKGWCGWKGPDFWDQNAHYNMCMPQRQLVI